MSALEQYYQGLQDVVLRDSDGNPSIFVRHPKQKSSDFSSILPESTHPAFICSLDSGNQPVEDPAILIGKYQDSVKSSTSPLYSLPYQAPHNGDLNIFTARARANSFALGSGQSAYGPVSMLTIADYGLLMLMAQKYMADGNGNPCEGNAFGMVGADIVSDYWAPTVYQDATNKHVPRPYAVGDVVPCLGYLYECIKAHNGTDSDPVNRYDYSKNPTQRPDLWKKLYRAGGVPVNMRAYDVGITLTGSGPLNWCFMHDPTMETDLVGNPQEFVAGFRLNDAEINIIPYNLAADPDTDLSENSSAWRAILPHALDSGYDLVAPGTAGTVHVDWRSSKLTYVAGTPTGTSTSRRTVQFKDITTDATSLPYVPTILYELGLLPLPGVSMPGTVQCDVTTGIKYMAVGRPYGMGTFGLGGRQMFLGNASMDRCGSRTRARELPST